MNIITITFIKEMFDQDFQQDISNWLLSRNIIHTNIIWVSIFKDGHLEIQSNDVQELAELCQMIGMKKANYLHN